jgi:hypothetical protein
LIADDREQLQIKRQLHLQTMLDAVVFRSNSTLTDDTLLDNEPVQAKPKMRFRLLHKLLRRRRARREPVDLDEVFVSAPSSQIGDDQTPDPGLSLSSAINGGGTIKLQRLTLLMRLSKQLTQSFQDQFDECTSEGGPVDSVLKLIVLNCSGGSNEGVARRSR